MCELTGFRPVKAGEMSVLSGLFASHTWPRAIIDAVLEGSAGEAICDDYTKPNVSRLTVQLFHILGGDVNHPAAHDLVRSLPKPSFAIGPPKWRRLVEKEHEGNIERWNWTLFSNHSLDIDHLQRLGDRLAQGFTIRRLDTELVGCIWSDLELDHPPHAFYSDEDLVQKGVGFCALHGDRVVSAALSFTICSRGLEMQINTHPDFQRRGLAAVVCASLLAHCLERGIQAHWGAANSQSAALAEKLGFSPVDHQEVLLLNQ